MKTLDEGKRDMWAKIERRRRIRIPEKSRREVEEATTFIGSPRRESDVKIYLKDLEDHIGDRFRYGEWARRFMGDRVANRDKRPKTEDEVSPSQKSIQRRRRIVDFVSRDWLTVGHIVNRSFEPRPRINWVPECEAWNKAYPYDRMNPEGLRVAFQRAIGNPCMQREYFDALEDVFLIMDKEGVERDLVGPDSKVRGILEPIILRHREKGEL